MPEKIEDKKLGTGIAEAAFSAESGTTVNDNLRSVGIQFNK